MKTLEEFKKHYDICNNEKAKKEYKKYAIELSLFTRIMQKNERSKINSNERCRN